LPKAYFASLPGELVDSFKKKVCEIQPPLPFKLGEKGFLKGKVPSIFATTANAANKQIGKKWVRQAAPQHKEKHQL
jgi:hypothetical protein